MQHYEHWCKKNKNVLWLWNYRPQAFVGALDHLSKDTSGLCVCVVWVHKATSVTYYLTHQQTKVPHVHLWVKFLAGEEQCKFLLCTVVTEPAPPQRDRVRARCTLRRVCFRSISEWMLKSEVSTFLWSVFLSVFKCFDCHWDAFSFVLFCFHRFVSVWQPRVISLFTALRASFPQCSSVAERLSFIFLGLRNGWQSKSTPRYLKKKKKKNCV